MTKSLTAIEIAALNGDGSFRVDHGLYLRIQNNGSARSWLFRYKRAGKTRWMGLGSARLLTLTEAKRKAVSAEKLLLDGTDPLTAKRKNNRPGDVPSFKECAEAYLKAHEPGWANPKHRYQWRATLEQLAYPEIGKLPVDQIDSDDIVNILEPIWLDRIETAKRLRGRIEKVLDWAKSKKYRTGENPAIWKGNLSHRLAVPRRIQKVAHHIAVPYVAAPGLYAAVADNKNTSALILRFIMLTACRYGEAAHATWREIDLKGAAWVIPADRMKMRQEHRVPLSGPALAILKAVRTKRTKPTDFVFAGPFVEPSDGKRKPVSDTAVRKTLRRFGPKDADTHGLRSTFRDWAAEQTDFAGEIAEAALAHTTGGEVELAYKRTAFFDKRRILMNDWADFLTGKKAVPGPEKAARS